MADKIIYTIVSIHFMCVHYLRYTFLSTVSTVPFVGAHHKVTVILISQPYAVNVKHFNSPILFTLTLTNVLKYAHIK